MKFKVRKGLESPCKIKGFLSTDYWIFIGCCGISVTLLFLGIRSGIMSGVWDQTFLILLSSVIGLPILRHRLKKRAASKKFIEKKIELTISNLSICKKINKRSII